MKRNGPLLRQAVAVRVGGTRDVRSRVGALGDGAVATLWHYAGKDGRLEIRASAIRAYDVRGKAVPLRQQDGRIVIPVGRRRLLLHFPASSPVQAGQQLVDARWQSRKPDALRSERKTRTGTSER